MHPVCKVNIDHNMIFAVESIMFVEYLNSFQSRSQIKTGDQNVHTAGAVRARHLYRSIERIRRHVGYYRPGIERRPITDYKM